jgi:hypothetical protein
VLAGEADLVLRRPQLLLELQDVLVRLEIGVILDNCEQRAERRGEHVLGRRQLGRTLGARRNGVRTGVGHVRQDPLLESHVALDGIHEIRDQVVATLELDLDLGERLVDLQPSADKSVVDRDDEHDHEDDDDEHDDERKFHAPPPGGKLTRWRRR